MGNCNNQLIDIHMFHINTNGRKYFYSRSLSSIEGFSFIGSFLFLRIVFSSFVAVNVRLFYLSLDRAIMLMYYFIFFLVSIVRLSKTECSLRRKKAPIVIGIAVYYSWRIVTSAIFGSVDSLTKSIWEYLITGNLTLIFLSLSPSSSLRLLKKLIIFGSIFHILYYFYEFNTHHKIISIFISADQATAFQVTALETISQNGKLRYSLNFSNPLVLAQYAIFVLSVSIGLRKLKIISNAELYFLQIVYSVIGFSTGSRMFMICFALNCGVLLISVWRKYFKTIISISILVLLGVLLSILIITNMQQQSITKRDQELFFDSNRFLQLLMATPLILNSPLWGYGTGAAADVLGFKGANSEGMNTVDNYYLSVVLDSGILGLLFFIYIVFIIIRQLLQNRVGSRLLFYASLLLMVTFSTLSISELHPLVFALIGISCATVDNSKYKSFYNENEVKMF